MSVLKEPEVNWDSNQMVEVTLNEPDDFSQGKRNTDSYWCRIEEGEENISVLPHTSQAR